MQEKDTTHTVNELMPILTNSDFLLTCYRSIRTNKGANTKAVFTPAKQQKGLTRSQRNIMDEGYFSPDGITLIYAVCEI